MDRLRSFFVIIFCICAIQSYSQDTSAMKKHMQNRIFDSAAIIANAILQKDPFNFEALLVKADIATHNRDFATAKKILTQSKPSTIVERAMLFNKYGALLYEMDQFDSSLYYLKKAFAIDSILEHLNYNLAVLYHHYQDDKSALYHLKLETNNHASVFESWIMMGEIELNNNNLSNVLEICDRIISINRDVYTAYVYKGIVYYRQEQYELALNEYTTAIAKGVLSGQLDLDIFIRRASAYSQLKKYQKALDDCDRAIKIDSTFVDAYHEKIAIYHDMNDRLGMCTTLKELKKVSPKDNKIPVYQKSFKCGNG